jgi:osmotically-inducible protein OsmY
MVQMVVESDATVQREVLQGLGWDSRVDEAGIGVQVRHGVVTLTGTVGSFAEKVAAEEAAHRVRNVLDVANDIAVMAEGPGVPTDMEIAEAVRTALEWDTRVPASRIRTTVADGWVTLMGEVDRWSQREDAERVIRHLAGVLGITNQIAVSAPPADAHQVRAAIEAALERRAEREARRLSVAVIENAATVSGTVRSWAEKQAVLGAAGHAPGVRALHDEIGVKPRYVQ